MPSSSTKADDNVIELQNFLNIKRDNKQHKEKTFNRIEIFKWFIVLGSFIVYFIADGVSMSFGIFTREFIDHFKKSDSKTFITTGLIQSIPLFMSPFVCLLVKKYNCRPVALVGSVFLSTSFISTRYIVNSLLTLNLTIGIITSLGLAMLYIPAYLIISFYFTSRRALATGIAVSGSGLGVMVLSPLFEHLIRKYGWMDTCLLFGAISTHTFISTCLFRRGEDNAKIDAPAIADTIEAAESSAEEKNIKRDHKQLQQFLPNSFINILDDLIDIYKNRRFLIVNLSYFFLSAAIATPNNFLPCHIKLLENVDDPSSIAISILGISNMIGQILIGFISDILRPYNWLIYVICIVVAGVSSCLLPFFDNLLIIYAYSSVFGLTSSVNYVLQSTLVIESLGLAKLTLAFGCLQLIQGMSTMIVTPLLGLIKDRTFDYKYTFITSGLILVVAGLLLILWPCFDKNKKNKFKLKNNCEI